MKTLVELEIAGFYVPDVVCGKAFPSPIPMAPAVPSAPRPAQNPFEIPLSKLTPEALDELCRDFRDAVFQKAGKEQPPKPGVTKEAPLAALDRLKSVLCDSDGCACIHGSRKDLDIVERALQDLDTFLVSL